MSPHSSPAMGSKANAGAINKVRLYTAVQHVITHAWSQKSTLRALTIKQLAQVCCEAAQMQTACCTTFTLQAYSNPNIDIAVCDGQDIDDVRAQC